MRALVVFFFLSLLTACSGDPRSFGITGPGAPPAPAAAAPATDEPDAAAAPGVSTSGSYYGPTNRPTTGTGNFWGYN
jgi:hypothetical protein